MKDITKIVVLSGAGVSAESGLGTFRDSGGLWEKYRIEDVATPDAWKRNPELVLDFYNQRRLQAKNASPNSAHYALAELQKYFDVEIITQNIDDLHERAGSENVLHLHGEIFKAKTYEFDTEFVRIDGDIRIGDLGQNGKQLRPHVVWFGESVPEMDNAVKIVQSADLLIVIGTSLNVYPAANLVFYTKSHANIILIDPSPVEVDLNYKQIQLPAGEGVPMVVSDLIAQKKESDS